MQRLPGKCVLCGCSMAAPVHSEEVAFLGTGHDQAAVAIAGRSQPAHGGRKARVLKGLQQAGLVLHSQCRGGIVPLQQQGNNHLRTHL